MRDQGKKNGTRSLNAVVISQVNVTVRIEPVQRWEKTKVDRLVDTDVVTLKPCMLCSSWL